MNLSLRKIIERNYYQPSWYSIIINPYYIARNGLLNKIKNFAASGFQNKNILDIGCGLKPYGDLFDSAQQYTGIDVQGGGHLDQAKSVDKFFDGVNIPFPDNSFEIIICTQVLEHCTDPHFLLKEASRVLKPGGVIFLTMPFVWSEHEIPYDFRRYTRYEHARIFKEANLSIEKIEETVGVFGVCGQLISAFISEKLGHNNKILKVILVPVLLCFPVQLVFVVLDFIFRNSWITLDYCVTAKKL